MITGVVNALGEARIGLTLRGRAGQAREIEAVVDTGFTGYLTLPSARITELQFEWLCREEGILGDGSVRLFDVYEGTVLWDCKPRAIEVNASETDALAGMGLIRGHLLKIEAVEGGRVTLDRIDESQPSPSSAE